jgi:hypothetical protein
MANQERCRLTCLSDTLPDGPPVLDASVVINVLGTGYAVHVLTGLGHPSLIEERTLREVLRHPLPGLDLEAALGDLRMRGLLHEVRMSDVEYEAYLGLASGSVGTRLGVGESAALAIATRGSCLVLDDRKARRRALIQPGAPPVASTLRLLLASAARQGWPLNRARDLVESARAHARMAVLKEELLLFEALCLPK